MNAPSLRAKRDALRAVRAAQVALAATGRVDEARAVNLIVRDLADEQVVLRIPCVVCRDRFAVQVAVDQDTTPDICLCVDCDDLISRGGGGVGNHVRRTGIFVNDKPFVPGEGRERK